MIKNIRIEKAIYKLSSFKLREILKQQIAKMIPLSEVSTQQLQKSIFAHFIMHSIKKIPQIKKLMIVIFSYQQNMHRIGNIDNIGSKIDYDAKMATKNIIMGFIKEIIHEIGFKEQSKEVLDQQENFEDQSPSFSQDWNLELINKQQEQLGSSNPLQLQTPEKKNSNQIDGGLSSPQSQVIAKQQFTNNDPSLSPLIDIFSNTSQQTTLFQKAISHGHFLHGDQIQQIKGIFFREGQIMAIIRWKLRFSQFQPKDSVISVEVIRDHSPLKLSTFYSSFLQQKERQKIQTQSQA